MRQYGEKFVFHAVGRFCFGAIALSHPVQLGIVDREGSTVSQFLC
jgi:hypothetical protein